MPRWTILAFSLVTTLAMPLCAATITVNDPGDVVADDGLCTLREAIFFSVDNNIPSGASPGECAAGDAGPIVDTLVFDLPPGMTTITPASQMSNIVEPVIIDGYSQPGASPNTLPVGSDAVLLVELDGSLLAGVDDGIRFRPGSDGSQIRGLVINRFPDSGIEIQGASGIVVAGNYLGLDPSGTLALGNDQGLEIDTLLGSTTNCVVGGVAPADRNVMSGNQQEDVFLAGSGHAILNNYIGTDASGTVAIPSFGGLSVFGGSDIEIGAPGAGNVVSGHFGFGISIRGASLRVALVDNLVGVDAGGVLPMPNGDGVVVHTTAGTPMEVEIGTPAGGNRIASNTADGVQVPLSGVTFPQGVSIRGNEIFANGESGIDLLDDGPTPNDPLDADDGPNRLQNWPEITSASDDGVQLTVGWALDSTPSTDFRIELFWNTACDATGFGEGEVPLTEVATMTDGAGAAVGMASLPSVGMTGAITATATSLTLPGTPDFPGGTSEFSLCVPVTGINPLEVPMLGGGALAVLILALATAGVWFRRRLA